MSNYVEEHGTIEPRKGLYFKHTVVWHDNLGRTLTTPVRTLARAEEVLAKRQARWAKMRPFIRGTADAPAMVSEQDWDGDEAAYDHVHTYRLRGEHSEVCVKNRFDSRCWGGR